jgi:hypothetical protein
MGGVSWQQNLEYRAGNERGSGRVTTAWRVASQCEDLEACRSRKQRIEMKSA